jgi:exosortase/archaeosortase family protein
MAVETGAVGLEISRAKLVTALCLLAVVNGLAADVVRSIVLQGFWIAAFDTFDVSIIVVAASIVGSRLMLRAPERPINRLDVGVMTLCGLLILLPHRAGSWIALTLLASYELVAARGARNLMAAASIFLATAVNKFWGAFFFQLCAVPLLKIDATLAGWGLALISGEAIQRDGNIIYTGHDQALIVATGCSSVANMSAAILCWVTIARGLRPSWKRADLGAVLFVCTAVVILNVLRISLMGLGREWLQLIHGPVGANVFNVAILVVAAATALRTAKTNAVASPGAR